MRKHQLDRWNYSEKAKKWVYVNLKDGKRYYKYRKTNPKKFHELIEKLEDLNQELINETDHEKKKEIFKKMENVSQQMQHMKK
jgi:hypothetical protein